MLIRNAAPFPPSLHGGVVPVTQFTSQGADAAPRCDNVSMPRHVRNVRHERTHVNNVDNVRSYCDKACMNGQATGEALLSLKKRANLSLEAIARAAGYGGRSSVQNYFTAAYDKPLDTNTALKIAIALVGKGSPPIERIEIMRLTGAIELNGTPVRYEGASNERMRQDVPILGTVLGAERMVENLAIEQTNLYVDEVIGLAKRPVILNGRADVYGLYVQGSSMWPAYEDGGLIFVEDRRQPSINEYAVVYLRQNGTDQESDQDGAARQVLIKRLIQKSGSFYEFEQFNPAGTFRISALEVLKMHRVIPWTELIS